MKNIILSLSMVMAGFLSHAQVDRTKAPEPGPAPQINIADPEVFELDNGLKVILSTNHKQPKVSFNLVMGSDPRLENNKAGLSDLLGDLLLTGTENRSKDEIDNEKDFIGASLYSSANSIYMSVLTKHMDKGLDIMMDVVKNANFPESEFDRIKKQYESNLATVKSSAESMSRNAVSRAIFPENHPYGENMTNETLESIKRADVVDLYKKQFTPAGAFLVIVGDIVLDEAKEVANKYFAEWDGTVPFEKAYPKGFLPQGNRVIFVEKPGAVQSVVTVAFPLDMTPGHEDQIKLSVLNKVFGGGGFGTRLMQNLREDKAWTYGAYSSTSINRKGSYLSASGSFRNEVTDSTIEEYLKEIKRITLEEVTEEELELNKASMAGSFARSLESPRTIANFALNIFRNDLPADYYQTYLQKLSAVTKEDLLEVAKKYFQPENLNIIVVGNEEVLESIQRFDRDGEIERFDAFGYPAVSKEYAPSDLTLNEVVENYLMAVTGTKKMKKANKRLAKLKSVSQVIGMKPQQAPVELKMKNIYVAPSYSYTAVEFSGMTVQKEIVTPEMGRTETMNQTGTMDTKEMSPDDLEAKHLTAGPFPEINILSGKLKAELLGMEETNNRTFYVVEYTNDQTTTRAYYDKDGFFKRQTESLTATEEGPQEANSSYSDFRKVKKIYFPFKMVQFMGSASFDATTKELEVNGKVDMEIFK